MMNWKGYGRKRSLPVSRNYPGICLEKLRKTTINTVRITGFRVLKYCVNSEIEILSLNKKFADGGVGLETWKILSA
jgi:hypothetical protein